MQTVHHVFALPRNAPRRLAETMTPPPPELEVDTVAYPIQFIPSDWFMQLQNCFDDRNADRFMLCQPKVMIYTNYDGPESSMLHTK